MRKTEQVTVGKDTYVVTQLPLKKSRALLIKLTNLLGPAFGEAVTGDQGGGFAVDASSIGKGIKTLATSLSDDDFDHVQRTLFEHITWINSQGHEIPLAPIVEERFGGGAGLGNMLKLMFEALKVNYSDFLAELGLADLIQINSPLESRQTSIGTSGE